MTRLQPLTRSRLRSMGERGATWQAELPGVLEVLTQRWSLTLGRSLPGGSSSYVVAAEREGVPCVLKVAVTDDGLAEQAATLRRADGRGFVRLLEVDLDQHALLLERLGPSLQDSALTPETRLTLLADTLSLAWQVPDGQPPTDKAGDLQHLVVDRWERLGRPCPARVVDRALAYAATLVGPDPADLVVVHGDAHPGNLLRTTETRPGAETGWCFVDPDGFVADRAYDLGVTLRDWSSRLLDEPARARSTLEAYAEVLAERSGVPAERIWAWGYLERVSTGLYVLGFGAERVGLPFLRSAELLL